MVSKIIFILFNVKNKFSKIINKDKLIKSHNYLKNKSLIDIKQSQFDATEKVFKNRKIPFRSFY